MTLAVTATLYERDVMTLAMTKKVELHQHYFVKYSN